MHAVSRLAAGGLAAGAACVAYGTFVERWWFRRRDHVLDGVLAEGPPLTVLHIADTHLTPPDPRLVDHVADLGRSVDADLVVATGDLLGAVGSEGATLDMLSALTADGTPGLVVLGSNDRFGPVTKSPLRYFTDPSARVTGQPLDTEVFVEGLTATGWSVLQDESTTIEAGGRRLHVSGLDDPHLDASVLPPDSDVAPPDGPADLHLGLVHAPYTAALDLLADVGAQVLLSGHTHGGQVRLPGVGALTANCDLPLWRARGVSRWRGRWLHVTPGLGQSCYAPYRFCCRPEASVLHLTN